jgi:hypothetical protein
MEQLELPAWYGIMDSMGVTPEMRSRLTKAGRNYTRAKEQADKARAELVAAIVAARKEGTLIEDIAALVPYRQTQVNRVLEAAGLTEKRAKPPDGS